MTRISRSPFFFARSAMAAAIAVTIPAFAQNLVLEEVIVTAQKRASTIQDISATVNVVTGDALTKFETFDFTDVEQQSAGMSLTKPNARNASIAMRGISLDPEAGASEVVTVYWNDQVIRSDIAFTELYDIERLEVLRGPQGTLQGRTSPGGAINMITRGADLVETSGSIQMTVADNDGLNTQVAYGGPIVEDKFALRIAAMYDENDSTNVENITTGLDPQSEAKSARLSANWQVTDSFNAKFVYQYYDREIDDPKALSGTDPLGERPTLKATDRIALGKTNDFGNLEFDLLNLTLNWELGDYDLVAVTGSTDSDKFSGTENDRANYIVNPESLTNQTARTETDTFSQEIRLSSSDNDFWDWMIGVFYLDQETTTGFSSNRDVGLGISFSSFGAIPVNREELGIFTFNTFHLSDDWQMEVGLRWADYDSFRAADVFYGGLNSLPAALEPIRDLVEAGISANFPIEGISEEFQTTKEDAITGSLTLRYEWLESTTLYAAYNRGYRPSGISILPTPAVQFLPNGEEDVLHDEENSDSFELGFKSRLWDGRATLNGALYYQIFDGYFGFVRGVQVLDDQGAPQDISGGLIFNGDANIWGIEFEGAVLLSENWSAAGTFSYAKGEWDDAEKPCNEREPGEVLGSCDIDGESLGGEPELTLSLNSEYYLPFESTEWYVRGLYKYTDERDNTTASAGIGNTRSMFEDHHIVNLYTGLRSSDYKWDVSLWVKNVLDSDEVIFEQGPDQYDIAATGGTGSYTQPNIQSERTVGLTARYNF